MTALQARSFAGLLVPAVAGSNPVADSVLRPCKSRILSVELNCRSAPRGTDSETDARSTTVAYAWIQFLRRQPDRDRPWRSRRSPRSDRAGARVPGGAAGAREAGDAAAGSTGFDPVSVLSDPPLDDFVRAGGRPIASTSHFGGSSSSSRKRAARGDATGRSASRRRGGLNRRADDLRNDDRHPATCQGADRRRPVRPAPPPRRGDVLEAARRPGMTASYIAARSSASSPTR
jgi:hypothetical protein